MTTTDTPPDAEPQAPQPAFAAQSGIGDLVFKAATLIAGLLILVALAAVFIFLTARGIPGFSRAAEAYGPHASSFLGYVGPLLFDTVLAAVIALIVAVPLAWGIALVISHYAPRVIATPVAYVIDLLAAVPSVVFGLWGLAVLAPAMKPVYVWLNEHLGWFPLFADPVTGSGRTILTAGLVLAIMILPIITALSREVFTRTPRLHQEAALALGATRWEMIRMTVFPYSRSGMVSAVMLGLGRALGETMAVTMVLSVGFPDQFKQFLNLVAPSAAPSIAANIALKYKERGPDTLSILIATGLVLFVATFLVNFAARWIVARADRKAGIA